MDATGVPYSPDMVAATSQVQVIPYGVEIPNRVFVGGCPYNMTDMELAEFFSQFGHIKDSKIITDRDTGKSRGYGFVTFMSEEEAASVHCRGSIYYKEKKLNVSKAIRKQGGQYPRANTEYMNGQRNVWFHPGGYLISQYDGSWHYEPTHPHTQPSKPMYSMYPQTGIYLGQQPQATSPHVPYLQNPMMGGVPPLSHTNGYTPGGFYSPTSYPYVTEQPTIPTLNPPPPSHPHTFTPLSTTTTTTHDEPRTSLEDSGSHSISSADPAHLSDQGATVTSEGEEPTEHGEPAETASSEKTGLETGLEHQVKQLSLDSAYTSEADITDHSLNKSLTDSARGAISENAQGSSSDSETSHTPPLSQELLKSIFSNRRAGSAPTSPYQQKRHQQRRSSRPSQHCVSAGGPQVLLQQPFL